MPSTQRQFLADTDQVTNDSKSNRIESAARTYRGNGVESIHYASIAVVDRAGNLTHYLGNPDQSFFARSSIKAFQVQPLVLSGAFDKFGFTEQELALMCASHNGSDEHRRVALSILQKAGNTPDLLQCGTHIPMEYKLFDKPVLDGEDKDPLRHNCSGKHSGFLAQARHLGDPVETYLDPNNQTQSRVRQSVADCCEYQLPMPSGTDGCSAPNYSMPMKHLAIGYKNLAIGKGIDQAHSRALVKARDAMMRYPLMVSGERRLDYDLMKSFPNRIVCKIGAEGIEAIGFSDLEIGIGIKVHDGAERALGPIVIEVLTQLGIIDTVSNYPLLKPYYKPEIKNYRKIVTGNVVSEFTLRKV